MKLRQRPAEAAPNTDLAYYSPAARPVKARDSRPRIPRPGTPDQSRMRPGATVELQIKASNKNRQPRKLYATGGAQLNRPGVTGSPVRRGRLT